MEFNFRSTETAKKVAKRLKKAPPQLKQHQAQEIIARVFGYANWHQFHTVCENNRKNGNLAILPTKVMITQGRETLVLRLSSKTGMTREAAETLLSESCLHTSHTTLHIEGITMSLFDTLQDKAKDMNYHGELCFYTKRRCHADDPGRTEHGAVD